MFHTIREGERALSRSWKQVEKQWEEAEAATRRVEQARRQTGDTRGVATAASSGWKAVEAAFAEIRRHIPFAKADRLFHHDVQTSLALVRSEQIAAVTQRAAGKLR